jgi:hypothetical protein
MSLSRCPTYPQFSRRLQVHAIVQFRVRDFGMEQCQLHLNLPDLIDPDRSANRSLVTSREATFVDVWRLDSTRVIAAEALSFATRPVRRELIVRSMPGGPGSALTSRRFPCPSDSLQTFEFTCVAPTCMLSFWQDGGQPVSGRSFHTDVQVGLSQKLIFGII